MAGIYTGRYVDIALIACIVGIFFCFALRKRYIAVGIIIISCGVGNIRGVVQNHGFETLRNVFETKTTITGRSIEDAEYDSRGQLAFSMNHLEVQGRNIPGQIAAGGFGEVSVLRGDTVEVTGKIFQARGSNQARMSFADLNVVEKDNKWYNALRRKLNKKLRDNLPEPQSSFASGLLIGQRSTIPDNVVDNLRTTGLAHIIAVSGYNLTIIIRFVMRVLRKLSRYQKLIIASSTIITFLLITGFSASIVRAAIVCGLSLLAWYYGRVFRPGVLLSLTAVGTALYRPEYIWGDAGWYLSFLAFFGILIVSPVIESRIYKGKKPKLIGKLLIETSSVLIMVTPYSLLLFGNLSIIALPANLLVVPLVPVAMGLSAICILLPHTLAVLAVPASLVLALVLELARVLANVPYASSEVHITALEAVFVYFVLLSMLYLAWRKTRIKIDRNILIY